MLVAAISPMDRPVLPLIRYRLVRPSFWYLKVDVQAQSF